MVEQPDFCTLLNLFTKQCFPRSRGGGQMIANLIKQRFKSDIVPRTTINNWLQGIVTNPQIWWQVGMVASVICGNTEEADQLLQSAGHMTLSDKRRSAPLLPQEGEVLEWWNQFITSSIFSTSVKDERATTLSVIEQRPLYTTSTPLLVLADDFQGETPNLNVWDTKQVQFVSVYDGRLWFYVPTNTASVWYEDVLEPRLNNKDYFVRIEFTIRLESLPNQERGYLGLQTDCDRGWLLVYLGESNPGLIVGYSRETEGSAEFTSAIRQRFADVLIGQDYKIELVWQYRKVTIRLDGQLICEIPAVPSRYLNLNAGVRPGMAVHGSISSFRAWA